MRIAVTGAAGHVGGNLVRTLIARGDTVRVLVRSDGRGLAGLPVQVVRGDCRERRVVEELTRDVELVFHLAAKISIDPRERAEVERNNVEGPRTVAEVCRERGLRLVHFSSVHALASWDGPIDETRPLADNHPSAYDRSKARGEREVLAAVDRGLDAVVVNPTGILGPLDFGPSHMGEVFLRLCRRQLPSLIQGGFNWVDVRDVVDSALVAARSGRRGERYLLGGTWKSMPELAELVEGETGTRRPRVTVPIWMAALGVPVATLVARLTGSRPLYTHQSLDALRHHRDVRHDKATRELGHRPRPLTDTVRDTFAWFKTEGVI